MFAIFCTRVKRRRTSKANSSFGSCSSERAEPNGAASFMASPFRGDLDRPECEGGTIPPFVLPVNHHRYAIHRPGVLMKVALIGASGFVGSKILAEALQRGHHV